MSTATPIVIRNTHAAERSCAAGDADVPLVLEARPGQSLGSLCEYLSTHTSDVLRLLYEHGALLLRGFPIHSTQDFEQTLFSIRALHAMRGYFMAELGRVLVKGSTRIFHSNAFMKTGGTLYFGGFHSENYYSSDVPAFIAFCCLKEPRLGGETGIVHMARAYQELDAPLRALFERAPACAISWKLVDIAQTYGVPAETAERLCRDAGFTIDEQQGDKWVLLYKPSVIVHPVTGQPSLHLNVSAEIRGINEPIRQSVRAAYTGPAWTLHRIGWRHPNVASFIDSFYRVSEVFHKPQVMTKLVQEYVIKPRREAASGARPRLPDKVGSRLRPDDVRALAAAIGRHTSMVKWRRGDLMIVDNLQMLHNGMPGLGERRIEAALCNPLALRWPLSSGVAKVEAVPGYQSVFERLMAQT